MAGNFASLVNILNRFAALPHRLLASLSRIVCLDFHHIRSHPSGAVKDLQLRKCSLPVMFSRLQASSAVFSRSAAINQ
jgi:hypothetical protein